MTGKTILVVDDEAHILHVVSLKLQNAGFTMVTANDGEEAVEAAAAASTIELVITDFQMPGMSGPGPGAEAAQRAGEAESAGDVVDGAWIGGWSRWNWRKRA